MTKYFRFLTLLTAFLGAMVLPMVGLGQTISSVSIAPNPVVVGGAVTGTVTLSKAAGTNGLIVKLTSSAATVASVPAAVTVAAGATSATFSVSVHPVNATMKATVTGTDPTKKSAHSVLVVNPPSARLQKLAIVPATIHLPQSATCTVTLSANASGNGLVINLSSSQQFISMPSAVTVSAGSKTASFKINGSPVTQNSTATIKGTDPNGYSGSATLMVDVPTVRVAALAVSPTTVSAGGTSSGVVTLTAVAPKGGFDVDLTSDQSFVTVPAKVTVKAGSKTGKFSISTDALSNGGTANLMAMDAAGYMAMADLTVTVSTVRLSSITISPSAVTAPGSATGTIKLSGPAPTGGFVIALSSDKASVSVPATVTLSEGGTTATFNVLTSNPAATVTATVKGLDPHGFSATGTLTVTPQNNSAMVQMTNGFQYSPQTLTVAAGTTVVWTNVSNIAHTVTPDLTNPSMTSSTIIPGQSFTWTVPLNTKSGTKFFYHCLFHGAPGDGTTMGQGMAGVVVVQ